MYSELQNLWTNLAVILIVEPQKIAKLNMKTAKFEKTLTL